MLENKMKQKTSNGSAAGSKQCPVGMDLAALGKKWSFHILRNIGISHVDRFNQILKSLPGLTPRVLIMRLNELEKCGLINPVTIQNGPKIVRWILTEKGTDTIPILQGYNAYVKKWHPSSDLKNHLRINPVKRPTVTDLIELARQETVRLTLQHDSRLPRTSHR